MAKKIDPAEQSNEYLSNLLRSKNLNPVPHGNGLGGPVTDTQPENMNESNISQMPADNMPEARRAGRKKKNQETKIRTSFTVLPSDFDNLRRIVYMERKSVSSILGDYIREYNESHKKALEDYYKLTEEERESFESGWK